MITSGQADKNLRYTRAQIAAKDLRHVADYIKPADFPGLAAKLRSAIKSADGAVRNARRFTQKTYQRRLEAAL
jgi:hypothetical protein